MAEYEEKIKQLFNYTGEETNTKCDLCYRLRQYIEENNVYDCTRPSDVYQHFVPSLYFLKTCIETIRNN